jgi:hypothetical protein
LFVVVPGCATGLAYVVWAVVGAGHAAADLMHVVSGFWWSKLTAPT